MNLINREYVNELRSRSQRHKKELALFLVSAALVTRMTAAPMPPAPALPVQPPTVIEYQLPAEMSEPVVDQAATVEAEPEVLGFWGLHRRIWHALAAPVKSGVWHILWRALSAVIALALVLFCALVWPLPQIWSRTKSKFKDFVASPGFKRFSFWAKLAVGLGLLAVYFLVPTSRRPWLLVIAAACLALVGLSYYFTSLREAEIGEEKVETQSLKLLEN